MLSTNSNMPKITKKAIRYRQMDGLTDPNYEKASLLITVLEINV